MALGSTRAAPMRWPLVARRDELQLFAEVLVDAECRGLLITGPPGVGKTRLADECATAASDAGSAVARATATKTSATVPLGALTHLLPAEAAIDPGGRFARAAAALSLRAGERRFVLVVDDLHLLDTTSVTLIGQLMEADIVFLVATVRAGEPISDVVAGLWRSERMARVDLAELPRDAIDTLLHLALGGPVESGTIAALWAASAGNVMFLRELVLGARGAGALVDEDGVWRLTGALVTSARLAELVQARVADVDDAGRLTLDLLALVGSAGLTELEQAAGRDALERLEAAGLITVLVDGRRHQVALAHPLYGEVLREAMPRVRRRRLLIEQAERIERLGARRREDASRIATWRLDATGTADPTLLVAAAKLARYSHDLVQVERLARAALAEQLDAGGQADATLLLGESLHELGRFDDADSVLAAGADAGADERVMARITAVRARNMTWGLLRSDDALALLRDRRAATTDPDVGDELVAHQADVLVMSGRPADALALLDASLTTAEPRARVLRALPEAMALALLGRCDRAAEVAGQGYRDHVALGDTPAIWHPSVHLAQRAYALAKSGRLGEALEVATANAARATADGSPLGRIWVSQNLGVVHLYSGRIRTAQRCLTEASLLARDYHYSGMRRITLNSLAMAAAWLGDVGRAQDAAAEADTIPGFGYDPSSRVLGRAWAMAAAGDVAPARAVLGAAAVEAQQSGHRMAEAWLLHDVVRLGAPERADARLAELAETSEGEFVTAFAEHAVGGARRSAPLLDAATDRFETIGALLFAAETATEAAAIHERAGERRAAAATRARAAALVDRCEAPRTPALVTVDAPTPLTRREREIVVLAARGLTSKVIAERLYLSARTVDNHLQNAYTKLGVSSRAELVAVVGTTDGDVS